MEEKKSVEILKKIVEEFLLIKKLDKKDGDLMCLIEKTWFDNLGSMIEKIEKKPLPIENLKMSPVDSSVLNSKTGSKAGSFVKEYFYDLLLEAFGGNAKIIREVYVNLKLNKLDTPLNPFFLKIWMINSESNRVEKKIILYNQSTPERFFLSIVREFKLNIGDKLKLWMNDGNNRVCVVFKTYEEFKVLFFIILQILLI
jgi:hypothetical protein